MIVIIGDPATGLASPVAIAAATRGRTVQLVGRIGDGPAADAVLQDLARHGVGHVAVLRDPSAGTVALEGADVELALRYLTDFDVVVLVDGGASVRSVADRAATWGGASLLVVDAERGPSHLAPTAGELAAAFAARVGSTAADADEAAAAVRADR